MNKNKKKDSSGNSSKQSIQQQNISTEFITIKTILSFILGFVFMFAFYIQFHGEIAPGGGFQSGIIFAMGFIVYDAILILTEESKRFIFSEKILIRLSALGVCIYLSTGLSCLFFGGNFFDYSVLNSHSAQHGRELGLFLIETGVALTVFGSISLMYGSFRNYVLIENQEDI